MEAGTKLLKPLWKSNKHLKHICKHLRWAEKLNLATPLCRKGCRRSSIVICMVAGQAVSGYAQAGNQHTDTWGTSPASAITHSCNSSEP